MSKWTLALLAFILVGCSNQRQMMIHWEDERYPIYAFSNIQDGTLSITLTEERTCEGKIRPLKNIKVYEGLWFLNCSDGLTAKGTYGMIYGKATRGVGLDSKGQKVEFSVKMLVK